MNAMCICVYVFIDDEQQRRHNFALKNKKVWVIGDSYVRNWFIGFMDVLRGNLVKPNESITKGVPEKFVKIPFLPKAFGDVGRTTIKSNNITAKFIGGRRLGIGLYMDE